MNGLNQGDEAMGGGVTTQRIKIRMLQQMAEALEDEAAGMYRRAAAFEEEEFTLSREIEERQTQINRLLLKLEALRADRDGVTEKIEALRSEAAALRDEAFTSEEEMALSSIDCDLHGQGGPDAPAGSRAGGEDQSRGSTYFRRMTFANNAR